MEIKISEEIIKIVKDFFKIKEEFEFVKILSIDSSSTQKEVHLIFKSNNRYFTLWPLNKNTFNFMPLREGGSGCLIQIENKGYYISFGIGSVHIRCTPARKKTKVYERPIRGKEKVTEFKGNLINIDEILTILALEGKWKKIK